MACNEPLANFTMFWMVVLVWFNGAVAAMVGEAEECRPLRLFVLPVLSVLMLARTSPFWFTGFVAVSTMGWWM